jgi:hypothetical protein
MVGCAILEARMKAPTRTILAGTALTALPALAAGCSASADPAETQVAADGTEAMMASTQSQSLASVVFEAVSVNDPIQAAAELTAPIHLWPSSCVTRSRDLTHFTLVHVTFHDCTGPFGLVHIDGEEDVTFSVGPSGALHAQITGMNLTANGNPVTYSASADITFPNPTTRSVVWQASWSRQNDAGDTVAHTSDLQVLVDLTAGCRTSDGTAITHVADRTVDTTVTDYKLCRDLVTGAEGCPSGTVVDTGRPLGRTVTVRFDASAVAQVTGPRGNTFDVPLVCTPIGH